MKKITIGARGSKLSLAYVHKVKSIILEKSNDLNELNLISFYSKLKRSSLYILIIIHIVISATT